LGPLNVLIGANAAGKSNLIEVISLLKAAPTGLLTAILRGGGVRRWIWLGDRVASPIATVECTIRYEAKAPAVRYHLEFSEYAQGFVILSGWLSNVAKGRARQKPGVYFERDGGKVVMTENRKRSQEDQSLIKAHESVLSRWKSPFDRTPISKFGRELERVRIFKENTPSPG